MQQRPLLARSQVAATACDVASPCVGTAGVVSASDPAYTAGEYTTDVTAVFTTTAAAAAVTAAFSTVVAAATKFAAVFAAASSLSGQIMKTWSGFHCFSLEGMSRRDVKKWSHGI